MRQHCESIDVRQNGPVSNADTEIHSKQCINIEKLSDGNSF